jgi:hypothetical protein
MQTAEKVVELLAGTFGLSITRVSEKREDPPSYLEMQVLKLRASRYAKDEAKRLQHPATNPDEVEADIRLRVAISDAENELTPEQRDELLQLIMDESGMTALKAHQLALAERRVG